MVQGRRRDHPRREEVRHRVVAVVITGVVADAAPLVIITILNETLLYPSFTLTLLVSVIPPLRNL